jgi:hypothetical protein
MPKKPMQISGDATNAIVLYRQSLQAAKFIDTPTNNKQNQVARY